MPFDISILPDWIYEISKFIRIALLSGALLGGITALRRNQGSFEYCDTKLVKLPIETRRQVSRPIRHSPAYFSSTPTTLRIIPVDWTQ